ncbi:sigma-70 family RNA polymerase sigma factor [Fusobacterium simiae]|uniref:Sigma-70 family RNA polymerase sigma factor n=1 Tax=Fusobacterium simiae TaxID=855 RepID=A0ABT4DK54_FUSSI|nr:MULTISPECIES: sigma-70 family RNA polymerase sigma factor [Fusobacterium]MCY7008981.1 sigma-70 family RNA polymerase sigma factor [Fusobacterium simiae]
MKLLSLEKYLLKNNIDDEEFKRLVVEISEKLELEPLSEDRKLTDEEIDYEYIDFLIAETLESLKDDVCTCEVECGIEDCCGTRVEKNLKKVYEIGLYMLRDGIPYEDLTQEGIIGLIKAHELFEDDKDFKLYKDYYIAREMFNYIDNYANYRKSAFKDYAKHEIHKDNHLKVSLKDRNKSEELKRLEKENKEKHIEEMKQLEKKVETLFDYLNLKYRLSEREIKVLTLYYGLDGHKKKSFSQIVDITKIDDDNLDKILKGAMFKLSTVDEKVEL